MPGASRPGAHFRVDFDDATFAEDLEHTSSDTGRELAQRERDKLTAEGLPPDQLKRCDTEARDGTSLPGCVKIYIPRRDVGNGLPTAHRQRPAALPCLPRLRHASPYQPRSAQRLSDRSSTNTRPATTTLTAAFVRTRPAVCHLSHGSRRDEGS